MFQAPLSNKEVEPAALHQPLFDESAKLGAALERHRWSVEVFGGRLNSMGVWSTLGMPLARQSVTDVSSRRD